MGDPIQYLEALITEMKQAMDGHKDAILAGRVQDYAEYRHMCGVIAGMERAISETLDMIKRIETS